MDVGERIKEVRRAKNLTQQAFADAIKLKRNTVATYEMGKAFPSDRTIEGICQKFDVNEEWLRNGVEPMFKPQSRNEELIKFATEVAKGDPGSVQAQILSVMARLTDDQWEVLAQVAKEFVEETKKAGPQ